MIPLEQPQKDRVVFAGALMGTLHSLRGEHPCTTFLCAEDGFSSWFHACFCTEGTVTIRRVERGEIGGSQESPL